MNTPPAIQFPMSVGAVTLYRTESGQTVRLFMLDSVIPLFNVLYGELKFVANSDQTIDQISALESTGQMPRPTWKWEFESGFERSVDGHAKKGWLLKAIGH